MDEAMALAMIRDHFEWASRDEVRASEIYAEDVVLEFPQSGERIRGKANVIAFRTAYPADVTFEMAGSQARIGGSLRRPKELLPSAVSAIESIRLF